MPKFKLTQKKHIGEGQYYIGAGNYFGFPFEQVGEELVTECAEKDIASLLKAKKVSKLTDAVYKELLEESEED